MQSKMLNATLKIAATAFALLLAGVSSAQTTYEIYLEAQSFDKMIDDGNGSSYPVKMWGFASCNADFTICDPATSPGPQIDAAVGDTVNIHLSNGLPGTGTPVSIIVPGQGGGGNPVAMATAPSRVGSMTAEAAPGGGTADYSFTISRAGTYLYQSGSYPSLQVAMGLYGAFVVDVAAGQAYDDIAYVADDVLLFSEVDPIQNGRVDSAAAAATTAPTPACQSLADYSDPLKMDPTAYPCTLDYNPVFLLVNGEPGVDLGATAGSGTDAAEGSDVLLRMLNAGLHSHTPSIVGVDMGLVAEDGNRYPGEMAFQSAVLLAAGKTIDAMIAAPAAGTNLSFFDRMPTFSNENVPNGGSLGTVFGPGTTTTGPVTADAVNDVFAYDENNPLSGRNVLDNDIGLFDATVTPSGGLPVGLTLNTDGTFSYTAGANETGPVEFAYTAAGILGADTANVTINVSFADEVPVARDDAYTNSTTANIVVTAANGVLSNDSDPDGDPLTASLVAGPSAGALSCAAEATASVCGDGSFEYTPTAADVVTKDSFKYIASDGDDNSSVVTVSLTTNPIAGIALNVVEADNPATVVTDFHWVVEEDATWQPDPDNPQQETLATNFHASYMPVIAQGENAASFADVALDPGKHYYVSVLPTDAHADGGRVMGGARIYPGDTSVTVRVNTLPTPYAQINVLVFNDNGPTNGAVDGGEQPLGGFQITLEDAGGRYGASAGVMSQDADANPLRNSLACFDGAPQQQAGLILTCPATPENIAAGTAGRALIKNLWPGKYGVIVTAPTDQATDWTQTSTIEGTKVIDAWVKANEPDFFQEFGPPGVHVFVGFVNPTEIAASLPAGGTNTVSGMVTNMHMSRPPEQTLVDSGSYAALAHTRAWVGLNSAAGNGPNYAAVQADENGVFNISGIPDGEYQLVVWDQYLDQIIAYRGVSLPADNGDIGTVPVFQWFTRLENNVFHDVNNNGVLDDGEEPMLEQNINLRWRDGTVYQAFPTDTEGFVPFDQAFPFFHWLVAEVDYARYEATGATVTIDAGGDVTANGIYNPTYRDGSSTTYTSTDGDLTFGFQGFLGQTSIIDWGKRPWMEGLNGGISGIVYYAVTRAENDPRLGAAEPWEPGVARAKVRLYKEVARPDGTTTLALVEETLTDSWDDSNPTGCLGAHPDDAAIVGGPLAADANGDDVTTKCYDGIRNFNQIRPGVFDGGYAFNDIPAGKYVVEVVPPPGYEIVKEEDVNVGFGEIFAAPVSLMMPGGALLAAALPDAAMVAAAQAAEPGLAQPVCVGDPHDVPEFLSLFEGAMEPAPFKFATRPLCDRKEVILSDQGQAAADFFLFTNTPIAAHFAGKVLDDIAQEFNVASPNFGEKWAPPFVPVSVRDYKGNEISRTYADQWGSINGLVPSTYSANEPAPSGMSPNMLQTCKNDSGPIVDTDPLSSTFGQLIIDPHFNPSYGTFCFTFQYMPGATTYLDTPVMPVSAFASGHNAVDCAPAAGTPRIERVEGTGDGPLAATGGTLTIYSMSSSTKVPNPAYEGPLATGDAAIKTIDRDYSFGGPEGTVYLNGVALDPDTIDWDANTIVWNVPADFPTDTYQLEIETAAGVSTISGITVEVEGAGEVPIRVPADHPTIQAAIDNAAPGELILVSPGVYEEQVILWKPVRLQGAGAGSTFINGLKRPTENLVAWRQKMDCLFGIGNGCTKFVDALPNQPEGAAGFNTEEGATITVVGVFDARRQASGQHPANSFRVDVARIDGFTITGGDTGGGIFVNGNAHKVEIANNHLFGNSGQYHGGIRFGRPGLVLEGSGPFGFNENANVHHNAVTQNGSFDGAGAGISIATGTDNYAISSNFVCGNFTQGDGAGIGHYGLSDGGTIANNTILFNQSFLQGATVSGGGLFVGGEPLLAGEGPITKGSGNVEVTGNLIQGNHAASGHGGGVRAQFVNGQDVLDSIGNNGRAQVSQWFQLTLTDNTIVNNVAGWSGGGVSLQDVAKVSLQGNTLAHNDSTATVAATFTTGDPNISAGQVAGLSSAPHSAELLAAIPDQNNTGDLRFFSNPELIGNVIWENRSFYYDSADGTADLIPTLSQATVGECVAGANYSDVGVNGGAYTINAGAQVWTDVADPGFTAPYCNGGRGLVGAPGPLLPLPALDEGGATWIDVRWGPITPWGDYN